MEPQNNSAGTVLVTVVIVVLIAVGVYFGFIRGRDTASVNDDNGGARLEVDLGGGNEGANDGVNQQ